MIPIDNQSIIRDSHQLRLEMLDDIRICNNEKFDHYVNVLRSVHSSSNKLGLYNRIKGDPLRSIKNHLLSFNSMSCLAAEVGGIDVIKSHYLAEKYAILIEEATSLNQLDQLIRDFLEDYFDPQNRKNFNEYQSLSNKVNHIIQQEFMHEISVERIADNLHLSREHVSRTYKKETGKNISDTINLIRIEEAKRFLLQTNLPITDIALTVGFNSSQYFSNVFKKYTNLSPKEFRNS